MVLRGAACTSQCNCACSLARLFFHFSKTTSTMEQFQRNMNMNVNIPPHDQTKTEKRKKTLKITKKTTKHPGSLQRPWQLVISHSTIVISHITRLGYNFIPRFFSTGRHFTQGKRILQEGRIAADYVGIAINHQGFQYSKHQNPGTEWTF